MRAIAELQTQQRYWLRNRETPGLCAKGSTESMYGCHPRPYHCLPRRRRRSQTYASLAIAKGHITRAFDTVGGNPPTVFRVFLLKRLPRKGLVQKGDARFPPH